MSKNKPTAATADNEQLNNIRGFAERLVKALCGYGGGSRCDCKYLKSPTSKTGESTGCCEARAIIELCEVATAAQKLKDERFDAMAYRLWKATDTSALKHYGFWPPEDGSEDWFHKAYLSHKSRQEKEAKP